MAVILVVAVGGLIVWLTRQDAGQQAGPGVGGAPAGARGSRSPGPGDEAVLHAALDRWEGAGLITRDQAESIAAFESSLAMLPPPPGTPHPPRPARRVPVAAEAVGYLGSALAASGVGLIVGRNWSDLGAAGRLGFSGVMAVLLLLAGLAVHEQVDPALTRLRWILWAASTAAAGLFAGVLVDTVVDAAQPESIITAAASVVFVQSLVLWRGRVRPIQEFLALVAPIVAVAAAVAHTDHGGLVGLAIWAAAAVVFGLGMRRLITVPLLAVLVGTVGLIVGSVAVASAWEGTGLPFAVATALGLLGLAVAPRRAGRVERGLIGVISGFALLQVTPPTIAYFAQDGGLAVGLVTWAAGAGILLLGYRRLVHAAPFVMGVGSIALLVGAGVTGAQVSWLGPIFALATAIGLVILGMLPGGVILSAFGSVGLLVTVPWCIQHFFPGEGRVPVLVTVSGLLLVGVAVLLTRLAPRLRHELRAAPPATEPVAGDDAARIAAAQRAGDGS